MSQVARRGQAEAAQPNPPLELVMVEVENPKPTPVEEVKEQTPRPVPKPPIKVASVKRFKRKENVPPPPNEPPPAEEPPRQAPLVVGMTMSSTTTGGAYANFLAADEAHRVSAAHGPDNYHRLQELKSKYDPENVFRANPNIPPAQRKPADAA